MSLLVRLEGLTDYALAHALQERLVALRAKQQLPDVVLFLEHPETITLGRRRNAADNVLNGAGVPVVRIERGGDATYHAPGQLVAYPIVALPEGRRDLRGHLAVLEDAVMACLKAWGLSPHRDERNTGVWLAGSDGVSRKVCSIGIACRQWVTWHGLALNLDVDLGGFARINPCGFGARVMTRLAEHLDPVPMLDEAASALGPHLVRELAISEPVWVTLDATDLGVDAVVERLMAIEDVASSSVPAGFVRSS